MKLTAEKTKDNPWWSSFSAEFFAALISLGIASFLIPRYLDWRKRPILKVINKETSKPICVLNISEDRTNYNGVFKLGVCNKTGNSYREVYWHLYIPVGLTPRFRNNDDHNKEEIKEKGYIKFSGQIKEPLYPYRRTILVKELELTFQAINKWEKNFGIYYSFSTKYGVYPEGSKKN